MHFVLPTLLNGESPLIAHIVSSPHYLAEYMKIISALSSPLFTFTIASPPTPAGLTSPPLLSRPLPAPIPDAPGPCSDLPRSHNYRTLRKKFSLRNFFINYQNGKRPVSLFSNSIGVPTGKRFIPTRYQAFNGRQLFQAWMGALSIIEDE